MSHPQESAAKGFFKAGLDESLEAMRAAAGSAELNAQLALAGDALVECAMQGRMIFAAGNGGSAADAQHMTSELLGKLGKDRDPIRALSLSVDNSLLTAIGNDYGYDHLFSRQLEGLTQKGDVFVAITTSGNSKNILRAIEMAKSKGAKTILLTGRSGGAAKALADVSICVPCDQTPMIQEIHHVIYHRLCEWVERRLVEAGKIRYR